jgi:glycine/D-amino acid oxidase-like deaminating enzyme
MSGGGPAVVIVGAGVAGAGAALAAARAGARVTVLDGAAGASTLWTGAIDAGGTPSDEVRAAAEALGVVLGESAIVTSAGLVRKVGGRDAAILDLLPLLRDRIVGVVRCERPAWDGGALVRTAGAGMISVDATILRLLDERVVPDAEFAARHDEPDRLGWLAERLRHALQRARGGVHALLLPPSLGLQRSRAEELSRLVGVPCGEATGMPGGPAGLRFERARDRALAAAGVTVVAGLATSVEATAGNPDRWSVRTGDRSLDADAVILAAGGLVGGGLEYQPSEAMLAAALPPVARPVFRCTIEAPVRLGAHGRPLDVPGSMFGIAPESIAWPLSRDALMDRVGVLCDDSGRVAPRLYAAGELVADAPRTWLRALESGVRAGLAAAREAASETANETVIAPAARPSSPARAPASRP